MLQKYWLYNMAPKHLLNIFIKSKCCFWSIKIVLARICQVSYFTAPLQKWILKKYFLYSFKKMLINYLRKQTSNQDTFFFSNTRKKSPNLLTSHAGVSPDFCQTRSDCAPWRASLQVKISQIFGSISDPPGAIYYSTSHVDERIKISALWKLKVTSIRESNDVKSVIELKLDLCVKSLPISFCVRLERCSSGFLTLDVVKWTH